MRAKERKGHFAADDERGGSRKSPNRSKKPPPTSSIPAIPSIEKFGKPVKGGPGGKPKSFCVPCSKNKRAATIRMMLRKYGDKFDMFVSPRILVVGNCVRQSAIGDSRFFRFARYPEVSRIWAAKFLGGEENRMQSKFARVITFVLVLQRWPDSCDADGSRRGRRSGSRRRTRSRCASIVDDDDSVRRRWRHSGQIHAEGRSYGRLAGLKWSQVPMGTQSFVLLFHDPEPVLNKSSKMDVTHWMIWNIPGTSTGLSEGVAEGELPDGSRQVSLRGNAYMGPGCPRDRTITTRSSCMRWTQSWTSRRARPSKPRTLATPWSLRWMDTCWAKRFWSAGSINSFYSSP